jgi:hypothetical protein
MRTYSLALRLLQRLLVAWTAVVLGSSLPAAEVHRLFPTPEAAVGALSSAVSATNRAALADLFGPAAEQLVNPDQVQGAAELADFTEAFTVMHRLTPVTERKVVLEIGAGAWPFPIPLVQGTGGWHFDTQAGVEEVLNRRIGRNELEVLRVVRGYVEAQREYAARDRDGDGVLEYAPRIHSSPGQTDGLYWDPAVNGEISPLGPFFAQARAEGYSQRTLTTAQGLRPFHGYVYRILTRQGKHAPGGRHSYIINGNMIAGFALITWPVAYGETGIMTFMVNQQGRVYQRDLGPKTGKTAAALRTYDPGPGWWLSPD